MQFSSTVLDKHPALVQATAEQDMTMPTEEDQGSRTPVVVVEEGKARCAATEALLESTKEINENGSKVKPSTMSVNPKVYLRLFKRGADMLTFGVSN